MSVKRPDDLQKVGLMVEVQRGQLRSVEEALLSVEADKIREALGCVTLNFRGASQWDCERIKVEVKQVQRILPEALIAGIGLDGLSQAEIFGSSGGNFYTFSLLPTKGTLRNAWPLPWAFTPEIEGIGCKRLYPSCGIDMLQAVTNWPADFGANSFIACFKGEEQFGKLWEGKTSASLAAAGAIAIEVRLEDAIAFSGKHPAIGEPRSAFGKLAVLKQQFLENVPS